MRARDVANPVRAADAGPCEVVVYSAGSTRSTHDRATCREIARAIAAIKGCAFADEYDPQARSAARRYFVPLDTLIGIDRAQTLGIGGADDLFGGVVPHAFVATKCISHPLVDARARVPEGWSDAFGRRVRPAVLDGCSAFSLDDALRGGIALLAGGRVRVKRALGIGGHGQTVVESAAALERALADADAAEVAQHGIAIERDLEDVTTHSVGQVRVDDLVASYYGTQRLTRNNAGHEVYGGSALLVSRGDFDALLARDPPPSARRAVEQARLYDTAAFECFDRLVASRRNYDVAEGVDASGTRRLGVLEQSWRVGGASAAEVAALAAFREDPSLDVVRATSTEVYGDGVPVPADATVYFDGVDERVGRLTKYVRISRHVHT